MAARAESISLMDGNNIIWTMVGPFSEDLATGLYAGMIQCIECVNIENPEINNKDYDDPWAIYQYQIHPQLNGTNIKPWDSFIQFGSYYDLGLVNTLNILNRRKNHGRFAIWLMNYNYDDYDREHSCWTFNTPEFIQGLLTMCRAFNVRYDDIIVAAPIDNTGSLDIIGYPLTHIEDYDYEPEEEPEEEPGEDYNYEPEDDFPYKEMGEEQLQDDWDPWIPRTNYDRFFDGEK